MKNCYEIGERLLRLFLERIPCPMRAIRPHRQLTRDEY
jgi:hypothetical protein